MYVETWCKNWCPFCQAVNWVCLGDLSDITQPDIDAIQCHKCEKKWTLHDAASEMNMDECWCEKGQEQPNA